MDKEYLHQRILKGISLRMIASEAGCSLGTIRYWAEKYNLKSRYKGKSWSDDEMIRAISESFTVSDVLRKLGLKVKAGNFETVRRFVKKNNIDIAHFKGQGWNAKFICKERKEIEDLLIKDSPLGRANLKKYLLKCGKIKNECSICSLAGLWNGKPIKMVLDHINGANDDHRLENLRMLCPNCNSQQSTFCRGDIFHK